MNDRRFKQGYFLIVDYNLSRIDDVRTMSEYARSRYDLKSMLVRARPSALDRDICDVVIDADPRLPDFVERALTLLRPYRGMLDGGLVFSDDAVHVGAVLLERLGLRVDAADPALAAASKIAYRERETALRALLEAQGIFVPAYRRVYGMEDLASFAAAHPAGCALKPACEGNNRGVSILRRSDERAGALREVQGYLADGVLCEELIPYDREFSYDGIGDIAFVTEKLSAAGRYPVEIAQLLPAALRPAERRSIERAGRIANLLIGQRSGPFHNEIKISRDGARAAVVEPNRRPAGMRIWQLAQRVYGVNLFECWVDAALTGNGMDALSPARGFAAAIMLGAPLDGRLRRGDRPCERESLARAAEALRSKRLLPRGCEPEWFDFAWLHGDADCEMRAVPKDNADFIARVCVQLDERPPNTSAFVSTIQEAWNAHFLMRYVA